LFHAKNAKISQDTLFIGAGLAGWFLAEVRGSKGRAKEEQRRV